jgi:antibiotic biosynthesis monooxygenase (ABM) superfamily enzyme
MNNGTQNGLPVAAVIRLRLRPGLEGEFSAWHARVSIAAVGLPGFISAEINAPAPPARPEWSLVQHFRKAEDARRWRESEEHRRLLEEAGSLVDRGDAIALREDEIVDGSVDGAVTEIVTTHVKPGKDAEYQAWAEKIHRVEAQFPGYRGGFLQPPASDQQHYWTTLVRFDTPETLDAWLNSDARRELLTEHKALVDSWEHHRLPTSFAGWFPTDPASGESPPSWKQSMLVVLMLFPIVMLELRFLSPILHGLNPSLSTFIGNVISVVLLAWPFMPLAIGAMNWWFLPKKNSPAWITPVGTVLLLIIYLVEIVVLARLL